MLRRPRLVFSALCALLLFSPSASTQNQEPKSPLRFRITLSKEIAPKATSGRLFVLMTGAPQEMATISIGLLPGATWVAGTEIEHFAPGATVEFDPDLKAYPKPFSQARPGNYQVMALLDHYRIPLVGSNAVVVGRSNIVGKPMALMLLGRDATVSICTSKTRDLKLYTKLADILVVAAGRSRMITGDMVKPGACVIDVGINRQPDGKLAGDVDFDSVREVAGYLTPVPGGVGPMTITMLLANTLQAAERRVSKGQAERGERVNAEVLP